jgi:hypothetical protein
MPLPDPTPFLQRLFAALQADGIDVAAYELDHLCYRVEHMDRYEAVKAALATQAVLLCEHEIGGRAIATFELHTPIVFHERRIRVIELPAPKAGSPYAEGWEHAEFVVGMHPIDFAARYADLPWDRSGAEKATNADVRLGYAGFSVKFHERSLAEVINAER